MSTSFNPYQIWLELGDSVKAPNYFELLGLDESEINAKTIAAAADRAASRVRRCRPGEHATEWAALLDQIADAKKCLTDSGQRSKYLRALGGKQMANSTSSSAPSSGGPIPIRATVDPNMYPPGLAPAMAPVSHLPAGVKPAANPLSRSTPNVPVDPQAPVAMQPYAAPVSLPMSPAGVPYLQPARSSGLADPRLPAVSGLNTIHNSAVTSPTALAVVDYGVAMVPAAGDPMAAVPGATPSGSAIPTAQPLSYGVTPYPMATAIPASLFPAASPFTDETLRVSNSSAALPAPRRAGGGLFGSILLGLAGGFVLLSIGGGYLYLHSTHDASDSDQVASGNPVVSNEESISLDREAQEQPVPPTATLHRSSEQTTTPAGHSPGSDGSPPSGKPLRPNNPMTETSPVTKAEELKPATDLKLTMSESPTTVKSADPTKSDAKPAPDSKPTPAADTPTKTEELPKPTKEELTKLGRAMLKAREAIGVHEFDRAEAFISVASEMPRSPEHQAMLDRLKLLSAGVSEYRKAIQASIGKLVIASSFDVGDDPVIVVETGPEKVIFRMKGQNRTYSIRDLPLGLATALAAQTLADDDLNTFALKGAYIMASPRARQEDLRKAREFLEKAAGSSDTAKELLVLFEDTYDLGAGAGK